VDIQNKLKKEGRRLTKPRQEIMKIMSDYPLSAQGIHNKLKKKNQHMNLTSVYRSLELFAEMGQIRVLELGDGKKRYERINESNHHHHFTCHTCGSIKDISSSVEEAMIKDIQKRSNFTVTSHSIELSGICNNCG